MAPPFLRALIPTLVLPILMEALYPWVLLMHLVCSGAPVLRIALQIRKFIMAVIFIQLPLMARRQQRRPPKRVGLLVLA